MLILTGGRIVVKFVGKTGTTKLVAIVLLVIAIWLVSTFVIGVIKSTFVNIETISYGELQDVIEATGYFVKTEEVILAPQNGKLNKVISEGERVRKMANVAEVMTPSIETASGQAKFLIKAPRSGIVSYQLDGSEQLFTPEGFEKLNPQKLIETFESDEDVTDETEIAQEEPQKGKPILKIIDNLKPVFLYLQIKREGPELFFEGEQIQLNLMNPASGEFDVEVTGLIRKVKNSGVYHQILVESNYFEQFLLGKRKIVLKIVKNSYKGYIVPKDSLVQKEGKTGLFIVYKEMAKWLEVEVLGNVAGEVSVKGLENGDLLNENTVFITNPSLVDEGENVN